MSDYLDFLFLCYLWAILLQFWNKQSLLNSSIFWFYLGGFVYVRCIKKSIKDGRSREAVSVQNQMLWRARGLVKNSSVTWQIQYSRRVLALLWGGAAVKNLQYECRQRLCPTRTKGGVEVDRESVLKQELLQGISQGCSPSYSLLLWGQ